MAEENATKSITVALPTGDHVRLDALREAIESRGMTMRKATLARDAMVAGLDVLEQRFKQGGKRRRA